MTEILRINNVNADTNRTPQNFQWNGLNNTDGSLENVFQANIWPDHYYNTLAQVSTSAPTNLSSLDATGKIGTVRFFASGQFTNNGGALKQLQGDIQARARVNLDYDVRSNLLLSLSTVYDKETIDETGDGLRPLRFAAARRARGHELPRDRHAGPADPPGRRFGHSRHGQRRLGVPLSLLGVDRPVDRRPVHRLAHRDLLPGRLGHVRRHVRLRQAVALRDLFDEAKGFRTITTSCGG